MSATPAEFIIFCDEMHCREHHVVPADSVDEALEIAVETYEWQVDGKNCYCPLHSDAA